MGRNAVPQRGQRIFRVRVSASAVSFCEQLGQEKSASAMSGAPIVHQPGGLPPLR